MKPRTDMEWRLCLGKVAILRQAALEIYYSWGLAVGTAGRC